MIVGVIEDTTIVGVVESTQLIGIIEESEEWENLYYTGFPTYFGTWGL